MSDKTTYRYRAVSPDGKYPRGWNHWPTWSGDGIDEAFVVAARDEWHPGYLLEVETTTVSAWHPLNESARQGGNSDESR